MYPSASSNCVGVLLTVCSDERARCAAHYPTGESIACNTRVLL